jgi:hypothetical protein
MAAASLIVREGGISICMWTFLAAINASSWEPVEKQGFPRLFKNAQMLGA